MSENTNCNIPSELTEFSQFDLPESLQEGIKDLGFKKPTLVQCKTYSLIREQNDCVIQSHTGSGKTCAFCLPLLTLVDPEQKTPQIVVIVPTRELAKQVALECTRLARHHKVLVSAIYGGASMEAQIKSLQAGAQVIVATPGRLKDLLLRKCFKPDNVRSVVLDEADEMLSMGFWEDVVFLLSQMPKEKQTLLFSATVPNEIEDAISSLLKSPSRIDLSSDQVSAKTIHHVIHLEDETQPKQRNLLYTLEFHNPKHAIVFCNTKDETDLLESYLTRFGYKAKALHGDLSQSAREKVMQDIRDKKLDLVIASDVAARGIDISGLTHVFNYELPENNEVYIHRTGRTGRSGALGTAVSLIRGKNTTQVFELKDKYDINMDEIELPSPDKILTIQSERLAVLLTEDADEVEFSQYLPVAQSMLGRPDATEILAFLLRNFYHKKQLSKIQSSKSIPPRKQTPRIEVKKPLQVTNKNPSKPVRKTATKEIETVKPDFIRLYITLGLKDGFEDLTELMDFISKKTRVNIGHFTGSGQIRDTSSHVEVDYEAHEAIIKQINNMPKQTSKTENDSNSNQKIICEVTRQQAKPRYKPAIRSRQRPRQENISNQLQRQGTIE